MSKTKIVQKLILYLTENNSFLRIEFIKKYEGTYRGKGYRGSIEMLASFAKFRSNLFRTMFVNFAIQQFNYNKLKEKYLILANISSFVLTEVMCAWFMLKIQKFNKYIKKILDLKKLFF